MATDENTAPEIVMDIEDLNRNLKPRGLELQQLKDRQPSVQRDIEALDRAGRTYTDGHGVSSSAPVEGLSCHLYLMTTSCQLRRRRRRGVGDS